jgi:YHS domain-containing protein
MFLKTGLLLVAAGVLVAGCSDSTEDHGDGGPHSSHSMERTGHDSGPGSPDSLSADANRTCPVTGKTVDPEVFVDYRGKRVYFCCKDCVDDFNTDPESYFAKAYPGAEGR